MKRAALVPLSTLFLALSACGDSSSSDEPEPSVQTGGSAGTAGTAGAAGDGGRAGAGAGQAGKGGDGGQAGLAGQAGQGGAAGSQGCLVAGSLYADGALDPANPCQVCDPAVSTGSWTPRASGTDCGEGKTCDGAGTCGECTVGARRCDGERTQVCVAGGQWSDETTCSGATPVCSAGVCVACNDAADCTASGECRTAACLDHTCQYPARAAGTVTSEQTANDCKTSVCDGDGGIVASDDDTDLPTDDGNPCTEQVCSGGSPSFPVKPVGTPCGAGLMCSGSECVARCLIEGKEYDSGALDPAHDCQACDPATSTSAWSVRPDNSVCGTGQYCVANVCLPTWHTTSITGFTPVYNASIAAAPDGKIYLFGGYGKGFFSTAVQRYDPVTRTATVVATTPVNLYRSSAVAAPDGKIYVMGGEAGIDVELANVHAFDPVTSTFTARAPMPQASSEHSSVLGDDGKIYVFTTKPYPKPGAPYSGGLTFIYTPATNTWTQGAPMPSPRRMGDAVKLADGRIAMMGGEGGYIPGLTSNAVEIYNPTTDTWSTGAPMPLGSYDFIALLRADNRVVVTSLDYNVLLTFVYDPVTNAWTPGLPTQENHRQGMGVRTADGHLHLISGRTGSPLASSATDEELY